MAMTFAPGRRSKLMSTAIADGGRLKGARPMVREDIKADPPAGPVPHDVPVLFASAGDVLSLNPAVIRHLAPKPATPDAETTKFVHLDFYDVDLPWRYTPRAAAGDQLVPWMVLLVGTT